MEKKERAPRGHQRRLRYAARRFTNHPVCAAKDASQHLFIAQPPLSRNCARKSFICVWRRSLLFWSGRRTVGILLEKRRGMGLASSIIDLAYSYAGVTSCEPFFANIIARNFAGFVELALRLTSCVLPGGS